MTIKTRSGPFVPNLGDFTTAAELQTTYPAASQYPGTCAYCADTGWVYADGTNGWRRFNIGGSTQYLTSGGSGTVTADIDTVILNGVNTTFALTFPAPRADGQELRVNAATAVSVAFSSVATAPATTINTTPSTLAAGVGVAWKYRSSDTTWYRLY